MPVFIAFISGATPFEVGESSREGYLAEGALDELARGIDSVPDVTPIRVWHDSSSPLDFIVLEADAPSTIATILRDSGVTLEAISEVVAAAPSDQSRLAEALDEILPLALPRDLPIIGAVGPEFIWCAKEQTFHPPPACH